MVDDAEFRPWFCREVLPLERALARVQEQGPRGQDDLDRASVAKSPEERQAGNAPLELMIGIRTGEMELGAVVSAYCFVPPRPC